MCSLRSLIQCVLYTIILTILSSPHYYVEAADPSVQIQTPLGTVTGTEITRTTPSALTYYSYRGIQYATATRFKAPKPVQASASGGTIQATQDGPVCPQNVIPGTPDTTSLQNENCLYLNIYTPQQPTETTKLPVLVFIHGGRFLGGTSSSSVYGPELIMLEKKVLLVTINYRVGIFGFLSTGTKDCQGNAGLKDQVEALKFVKNQITYFGGDPNKVTIFGDAASVIHHLMSPMSKDLFQRAIAESGSALSDSANIEASVARDRATKIAKSVGCDTQDITTMVNCLSKMTVSALLQATSASNLLSEEEIMETGTLFSPVIETKFDEDVFLADYSENVLNNVTFTVPLIIGTNKDEGMLYLTEDKNTYDLVDKNLKYVVPRTVKRAVSSDKLNEFGTQLRKTYFNGSTVSTSTLKGYVNLYTDHLYMYPTAQTVRKLVEKKTGDVYLYHFAYSGNYKALNQVAKNLQYDGVAHGEELGYLFYIPALKQDITTTTSADYKKMKTMIKLWITFATNGVPTSTGDAVQWTKVTSATDLKCLEIGTDIKDASDYYKDRIEVWDQFSSSLQIEPTILLTLVSFFVIFKLF